MSLIKSTFKSALFGFLGRLTTIAVSLLITPYLINSLGQEGYGLWLLIFATYSWFLFIDLGFFSAVQRSIAIAVEIDDREKINTVFSCSLLLFGFLGLIAALLLITLSFFPELLGVSSTHYDVLQMSLIILSLKVVWTLGMSPINGLYSGLMRLDIEGNITAASEIFRAVLIYFLVKKWGILGIVFSTMIADIIANICKIWFAKKLYPYFSINLKLVSYGELLNLFNYSKHVLTMVVVTRFNSVVDTLVISHLFGLNFITIFGVANRFVQLIERLLLSVLGIFLPVLTRLSERKGNIQNESEQLFTLNNLLVPIILVPAMIFTGDFFYLWLGDGFQESSIIVIILSFSYLCKNISRPVGHILMARADHKLLALAKLAGLLLNVLLSLLLGYLYGLIGVAIATLVSQFFSDVVGHLFLYQKHTSYRVLPIINGYIKTNLLVLFFLYVGNFVLSKISQLSWSGLIISIGLTLFWVAFCFWFLICDLSFRKAILAQIKSIRLV